MKTCKRGLHQFEGRYCRQCKRAFNKQRTERRTDPSVRAQYLAYQKAWREQHRDHHPEWRKKNHARWRTITRRRRAVRANAPTVRFSTADWLQVIAWYGGRCAYCPAPWAHQDHVVPLSKGGAHALANVVPACMPCNIAKKDQTWTPARMHPYT